MRIFLRMVLALVLIGALIGLGTYVYNAGVTQGLAASGKLRCRWRPTAALRRIRITRRFIGRGALASASSG